MDVSNLIILATEQAAEAAGEKAGFIGTLGLNWKLFVAQLINFGIVVLILWKWVFGPVTRALEGRRQRIENSLRQAQEIEKRMQSAEAEYQERLKKAQAEAALIIGRANDAAEASKKEIMEKAKAEAERVLQETKAEIAAGKESMLKEIREEAAGLTVMATEKILREKLDEKKDKELVRQALKNAKT